MIRMGSDTSFRRGAVTSVYYPRMEHPYWSGKARLVRLFLQQRVEKSVVVTPAIVRD